MRYTELQVTSNFSFLRGASHPEELVQQAAEYGYSAIAITDRNSFAGIVRGHAAAKECGIRIIPACRLDLLDGPSLLAYPVDKEAYGRLSALLTTGNLRAEKGECHLYRNDVYEHRHGIKFIVVPPATLNAQFDLGEDFKAALLQYREAFGKDLYLGATRSYDGDDQKKLYRLARLAETMDTPMVATNDVHYHIPQRRELQDVLTCVREKTTIREAGYLLHSNAERYLKPMDEMERLFMRHPDAVRRSLEIEEACRFSLDSLKYIYPEELTTGGRTPQEELTHLAWEGAREHFGDDIPKKISNDILYELAFMEKMDYAPYFLTVHDIVRFARKQGILCQGRGSAANSTVCFCLGITAVNPLTFNTLFERFISSARNEPPDIDVDFEHERREEVIQYIYEKYGRDRAAIVATVTQLRQRGSVRDVGKAMGLSLDMIDRLSGTLSYHDDEVDEDRIREEGLDPSEPLLKKVLELTRQMMGFPRQLGQHTGGFVITRGKLTDLCPVMNARMENRTCIEWNKDDIDTLGFLKIDVLALGMLTCIRKAFDLAKQHYGEELTLANIPQEKTEVYEMISRADTIGVFQIESRAQMSMLPRLRPKCFYDLVIEVAIVRPGPIQGDMVHPYLRRRNKEEAVEYPSKELEEILKRTLGVPLFQEQAMQIAIDAAGFTPAEADELRRSMATFKSFGKVSRFEKKLIDGMVGKGYKEEFARRVFRQLEGFGSYGFPESHAVSFALLVYVSSWLKCFHPDVFATALLNSMPMGFYQPAQIVIDARKHGVEVRPVDVNHSFWDNTLENSGGTRCAIRLGFRQVGGLKEDDAQTLTAARGKEYASITAIRDAGVPQSAMEKLADADAFRSLGLDRRQALWEISALHDRPQAMFAGQPSESAKEGQVQLPFMTDAEHVLQDYASVSLSLKAHPVSFVREQLKLLNVLTTQEISEAKDGSLVKVAGLVLVRQRPSTASGVCFITVEDETSFSNLVVFETLFEKYRREINQARLLMVEGKLQREGEVVHVIVQKCYNLTKLLKGMAVPHHDDQPLISAPQQPSAETDVKDVFYKGRNFR
ncbi:MAG: error-prone DNA polymerase [Chitinophaga sp.]